MGIFWPPNSSSDESEISSLGIPIGGGGGANCWAMFAISESESSSDEIASNAGFSLFFAKPSTFSSYYQVWVNWWWKWKCNNLPLLIKPWRWDFRSTGGLSSSSEIASKSISSSFFTSSSALKILFKVTTSSSSRLTGAFCDLISVRHLATIDPEPPITSRRVYIGYSTIGQIDGILTWNHENLKITP